jgi:hypothetical protein
MSTVATIYFSKSGYQPMPKELDPKGEGFDYGHNLARIGIEDNNIPGTQETFDNVAKAAGAAPLSAFLDYSDQNTPDLELDGLPLEEPKWFPVEGGLKTVEVLLDDFSSRGIEEGILWDLRVAQAILKSAIGKRESFRMVVM